MTTRSNRLTGMRWPFTLIELLLVIAIMIIIIGFTTPAFRKMATGNAVNASARMISGQLNLARAAAIAEQKYLALVMPGGSYKAASDLPDDIHFRAFRVAVVEPTSTDYIFTFKQWYPGTSWTYLPNGAVIADADELWLKDATSADENYEIYEPTSGRTVNSDWPKDNKLIDDKAGVCCIVDKSSAATDKLDSTENNLKENKNFARAVVFSPKGRCCVSDAAIADKYVTIVEGKVEGSASDWSLTDANKFNMQIIKVAKFTGKVDYADITKENE